MRQTTQVTVRDATPADMDVVWAFVRKKAAFDNWLDRLEATPQSLADAMFCQPPVMGVLLAESGSRPVGFASYFFTFSTYLARRCVWLDDLYVDEDARARGIGTELLRALARVSIKHGCPRLEWVTAASNAKAIGFYERLGADVRHGIRVCRLNNPEIVSLAEDRA
jgi:GNAT superfamily N-acetyltransferase